MLPARRLQSQPHCIPVLESRRTALSPPTFFGQCCVFANKHLHFGLFRAFAKKHLHFDQFCAFAKNAATNYAWSFKIHLFTPLHWNEGAFLGQLYVLSKETTKRSC